MAQLIPLTQSKYAVVDDTDFAVLSQHKWSLSHYGYAQRRAGGTTQYMHRVLLGLKPGEFCDHRNRIRTDNQRSNLRRCDRSQNQANRGPQVNNRIGAKGVDWFSSRNKWRARIASQGKTYYLGYFLTKADAIRAYNKAALYHHGEFARINS